MPSERAFDSPGPREADAPLTVGTKTRLAAVVVLDCLCVSLGLRLLKLAPLVKRLRRPPLVRIPPLSPRRLGRIVDRLLRLGSRRPRCLVLSLVLFRLLLRQGTSSDLVIGLTPGASSYEAHAWVEVDGRDVGPPPGRLGHEPLARYGGGEPAPGS